MIYKRCAKQNELKYFYNKVLQLKFNNLTSILIALCFSPGRNSKDIKNIKSAMKLNNAEI